MHIVGLSAFYHESACCLLSDGRLVAAAAEERFTRRKHEPRLPVEAFRFCLERGGLDVSDLSAIAYYEEPVAKLSRQLWAKSPQTDLARLDPGMPEREIRERLGWDGPLLTFPHHLSHGASAYYFSGFPDAAVLTVDGVGEWDTTTLGRGVGDDLEILERVEFPHSLGLLYSTITSYLGFRVNGGEYKVMGLAPYGRPRFVDEMRTLVRGLRGSDDGLYRLDLTYFDFVSGQSMYSPRLIDLFGTPPRAPEGALEPVHQDIARSLQVVLEERLLALAHRLHELVPSPRLSYAGGVALNCVANRRLRHDGPFDELFVQPAAGDAGGSLGAAALAHRQLTGRRPSISSTGRLEHAAYGPSWSGEVIAAIVSATGLPFERLESLSELADVVARHLAEGAVVGWFTGAMEVGPRALGQRSILASPLIPDMRDRVNALVKKREGFRPFAPSVLAEHAADHFDLTSPSPFMLETARVVSPLKLPAITHVDGSARPQTVDREHLPRFAALLDAFHRRTGCPMLLNTSFNVRGEPIVATPADALLTMASAGLDLLVLEDRLLHRADLPEHLPALVDLWRTPKTAAGRSALSEHLYTFV